MIQSWLAGKMIRFMLARLNAGDMRPTLWMDRPDVVMTFPGQNSFAGVVRGRDEHRVWLQRLVDLGLQHAADEVVAVGPPWRTTVCLRGHDWSDAEPRYANRYVIWGTLRWGRMAGYEVYEDTHVANEWDRALADRESPVIAAV